MGSHDVETWKKEQNKTKKSNLLKEMDAFPEGKTAETITVIQIVNFLKGIHDKWKLFSPVPDGDFQDLNKSFKESRNKINQLLEQVEKFNKGKKEEIITEVKSLSKDDIDASLTFRKSCREGICGMCSLYINGSAHGPEKGITTCQLHMRAFNDGDTIYIEPFRAKAFPVIKDLIVDRSAFDRIQQSGAYVSVNTSGNTQDANAIPIPKEDADEAFSAATCIGCGACVASCKNSSAMLFTAAKISQYSLLPQGQVERKNRAINTVSYTHLTLPTNREV